MPRTPTAKAQMPSKARGLAALPLAEEVLAGAAVLTEPEVTGLTEVDTEEMGRVTMGEVTAGLETPVLV
jgi:hypothetical protein